MAFVPLVDEAYFLPFNRYVLSDQKEKNFTFHKIKSVFTNK